MADSSTWWRRGNADEPQPTASTTADVRRSNRWDSGWGNTQHHSSSHSRHGPQHDSKPCKKQQLPYSPAIAEAAALTTSIRLASSVPELQQLLERNRPQLGAAHVSAAYKALTEMTSTSNTAVKQLLHNILLTALDEKLEEAESMAVSQQISTKGSVAQQARTALDSRACAVILSSLAQLQWLQISAFKPAAERLAVLFVEPATLQDAIPQGIGMVASAAAKLRLKTSERQLQKLLAAFPAAAAKTFPQPANISQMLWGVATCLANNNHLPVSTHTAELFTAVEGYLLEHPVILECFNAVEICNTLSAFTIAELQPTAAVVAALLQQMTVGWVIDRASPQDLSRTVWALAKLAADAPVNVCKAVVAAFCRRSVLSRAIAQDVSNMLWGLGVLHQQDAVTSHEMCLMASAVLDQAKQHRAEPQEISTSLWGLATLEADLPHQLMVQLQEQFREPHILAAVAQDEQQSLGLVNTLWAAADLHRASKARTLHAVRQQLQQQGLQGQLLQLQQQDPILSPTAVRQLTDMLTTPKRLAYLSPCSVSLCAWSVATLGGSLSQDQCRRLVQRFLQPSCQTADDFRPQNYQNLVWGLIKLGQQDVLIEDSAMQRIVEAYLAAWEPGGRLYWRPRDPMSAAVLMWGVAQLRLASRSAARLRSAAGRWQMRQRRRQKVMQQQLEKELQIASSNWQQHQQGHEQQGDQQLQQDEVSAQQKFQQLSAGDEPNAVYASPAEADDPDESATSQQQEQLLQQSSRLSVDIPASLLQRLFSDHMHAGSLAVGNAQDIAMALWAAAELQFPMALDHLQWLLSTFMAPQRLHGAHASSLAYVLFAVAKLMKPALLSCSSSSSISSSWQVPTEEAADTQPARVSCSPAVAIEYSKLLSVQLQLLDELVLRLNYDVRSHELSGAVHGLLGTFEVTDQLARCFGWDVQRQLQLQQGLLHLLQQLNRVDLQRFATFALVDVLWACWQMGVVHPEVLHSISSTLLQGHIQHQREEGEQQQQQRQQQEKQEEDEVSLRPYKVASSKSAALTSFSHSTAPKQQLHVEDCAQLVAALASLNQLTSSTWATAVQQVAGHVVQLGPEPGLIICSRGSNSSKDSSSIEQQAAEYRVQPPADVHRAQLHVMVPLICWAAAVADLRDCRGAVLQLCSMLNPASAIEGGSAVVPETGTDVVDSPALLVINRVQLAQLYQVHMWLVATATPAVNSAGAVMPGTVSTEASSDVLAATAAPAADDTCALKLHDAGAGGLAAVLTSKQLQQCKDAWCSQVSSTHPSAMQWAIARTLQQLPGITDIQVEALTADNCFSIDVVAIVSAPESIKAAAEASNAPLVVSSSTASTDAVAGDESLGRHCMLSNTDTTGASVLLAVEADGPHHFLYPSGELDGESKARTRALEARGYLVSRVPYDVWDDLGQKKQQQAVEGTSSLVATGDAMATADGSKGVIHSRQQQQARYLQGIVAELLDAHLAG